MLLLCLAAGSAFAQTTTTTSSTDGMTPAGLAPGSPAGSYALSGFDTIAPFSQSLNFRLPLMAMGGRGVAGYTMMLPIERKWRVEHDITDYNCPHCESAPLVHTYRADDEWWDSIKPEYGPGVLQGRYGVSKDRVQCSGLSIPARTLTRLTFTTSDGTEYELRDRQTGGQPLPFATCINGASRGTVFVTADGTSATFISDSAISDRLNPQGVMLLPSGYLLLRDGTRYRINGGIVEWIRDRNGNSLHYEYRATLPGGVIGTRITDSTGRIVTITYANTTRRYDEINYKGFGGAARTIRVWYDNLYNNRLRPANAQHSAEQPATNQTLFPTLYALSSTPPNTQDYNPEVVAAVELPDQQRRYNFYYNSYGELARVELPTGGAFEYDFQQGEGLVAVAGNPQTGPEYEVLRRVVERRVYGAGGALESRTTFGPCGGGPYPTGTGNSCVQVDQKDPNNNNAIVESSRHYYYGNAGPKPAWFDSLYYSEWNEGKEFITEAIAGDGATALRRTEQTWRQRATPTWWSSNNYNLYGPEPSNDPRSVETTTTLLDISPNLVTKQSAIDPNNSQIVGFDQFNNQTDVWEYGYGQGGAGALLRRTHTDYAGAANLINGINYGSASTSNDISLRSLPVQKSVYDALGILRAQTTFEYDNYAGANHAALAGYTNISGLCTSFDINHNCSNVNPTAYTTRGNVTSTSTLLLQSNQPVNTYAQYDVAGNVVKTIDARGYVTTLDYTDQYGFPDGEARANYGAVELGGMLSYSLPTSVTNALGHTIYAQYDYYLGRVVNGEDANGVIFTAEYGNQNTDRLDRPSKVVRAVNTTIQNQTTFSYDDTLRIVTSNTDQSVGHLLRSETLYDGLGRTTETRQYESSNTYIATKQKYDTLGRVKETSNPFRPGDALLWTTTQYDALGRPTSVTTSDSAVISTLYSGNLVTVTDQAGKDRQSKTDALGRLIEVIEDPGTGGLNYQTIYGYDVLDNLTTVTQGSQTRTFVYDSLKRLTSATNPESGTLSYQYDPAGNLTLKIDARGISTVYTYDDLNRVTLRNYSDATPDVTYTYDTVGVPNSKGKLTSVSSTVSVNNYTAFDVMGRVTSHQQVTDSQTYGMSYGYNLAGALTSETYPSGRTVTTDFDDAGRVISVTGQKTGENNKTYASQFVYASNGAAKETLLGNGSKEQTVFDPNRLQPLMIKLSNVATGQSLLELHYYYGGTQNNGNVWHHTSVVDGMARLQVYEYDQLNRLKKGHEVNQSNGALHWQQEFTYDRYGNRNFDVANTTPAMLGSNLAVNPVTNRFTSGQGSIGYDNAGNLTSDFNGHTFAYDAENKQTTYDNGQATYSYDGDGRRVKKVSGSVTTIYVYDAVGQLVAEYSTSSSQSPGGTSYLTSDNLGTPRVITDQSGAVKSRHDYLPFGEEIAIGVGGRTGQTDPVTGGVGQKYVYGVEDDKVRQKFTQKERDRETGLDYFLARYYSSTQGRFTSPDEFTGGPDELFDFTDNASDNPTFYADLTNPQSLNKYQYAYNAPTSITDSDGHCPICWAAVAVAAYIVLSPATVHAPRLTDTRLERGHDSASQIVSLGAAEAIGGPLISKVYGAARAGLARGASRGGATGGRAALQAERENLVRVLHKRELSYDPAIKRFRPAEGEAGYRLEAQIGRRLTRHTGAADFVDKSGRTYDLVGAGLNSQRFDYQAFTDQIITHLGKADRVVADLSRLNRAQAASVRQFVNGLSREQSSRIIILR
jgi:RHS repeat-associated protein